MAQLIGYAVADEDIDVQIAAVRTLGQMSTPEANAPLSTALDSPFPSIRAEAALALGRRGIRAAVPRIRALLEDSEPVVISAALDALAWFGDDSVANSVERALEHHDDEVFQAGLRAARTLPEQDAELSLAKGLEHSAWNVRMLATKLLLEINSDTARQRLIEVLAQESDSMVRHAIESGLQMGD
jgi:HEAT repeat protein